MATIDTEQLLEDVEFVDVLSHLGVDMVSRGNNIFIKCPDHLERFGRNDHNIGNCIVKGKYYYCYSCKAKGNIIHYVCKTQNVGFMEAVKIIAAAAGETLDKYEIDCRNDNGEWKVKNAFPLSANELALLGLNKNLNGTMPDNMIFYKKDCQDDRMIMPNTCLWRMYNRITKQISYEPLYITGTASTESLIKLYSDDPESFYYLIRGKIREKQSYITTAIDMESASHFFKKKRFVDKIEKENLDNLEQVNQLAVRFGILPVRQYNKKTV